MDEPMGLTIGSSHPSAPQKVNTYAWPHQHCGILQSNRALEQHNIHLLLNYKLYSG